ncbi:EF-hand domain-containing protein [Alteromonas sp. a30]|uniref:EF-hand domain-containing protein n=1 Tax=Alteromonas sp. a30 TaxID=2730917 RepID=UPI00227E5476|nr:EF-hand domain-containing protein [Alteromonas sp. a30]MCY7295131.1 EF-hand domain-containing protein [Alteromonas sp. a30]
MSQDKTLSPEQVEKIREDFAFFDKDQNGRIDQDEFFELLTVLSPKIKPHQAQEGFSLIDKNGDGVVDFEEFLDWWQNNWWEY